MKILRTLPFLLAFQGIFGKGDEDDEKMEYKPKKECEDVIHKALKCKQKVADIKAEMEEKLKEAHDKCFIKNGCEGMGKNLEDEMDEEDLCGHMVRENVMRKLVMKCAKLPNIGLGIGRRKMQKLLEQPPQHKVLRKKRQAPNNMTQSMRYGGGYYRGSHWFWPCKDEKSAKAAWDCAIKADKDFKEKNKKAFLREQLKETIECFDGLGECAKDLEMRQKMACHCVKKVSCHPVLEAAASTCAPDNADPDDISQGMNYHLQFLEDDICCKGSHCRGPYCGGSRGMHSQAAKFKELGAMLNHLGGFFGQHHKNNVKKGHSSPKSSKPKPKGKPSPNKRPSPGGSASRPLPRPLPGGMDLDGAAKDVLREVKERVEELKEKRKEIVRG